MYENSKADYIHLDEEIVNQWNMRNQWPAIFGNIGDGLSLAVLILSIVPSALFGAAPFKLALLYFCYANILRFFNLTTKELFIWIKYLLNREKINVPSYRQSSFFALPLAVSLLMANFSADAVEIIEAKPKIQAEEKQQILGNFFINNTAVISGHGDVDIKTLLSVIIESKFDYQVVYDDKELESMVVSWRSLPPRELTIDQILGSLSVRYGVYFYTTRGSLEIHVAWLRDTAECKKRDGVYLRLCGIDAGTY